jgi:hypothetical protein
MAVKPSTTTNQQAREGWKASNIKAGDQFTISGFGQNASGDMIKRLRNDNKEPPFWGLNMRTKKRGKAISLMIFTAKEG